MPIRAFVDANLFVSFLLNPAAATPPATIVWAGLAGAFTLLVSERVVAEFQTKIATKAYLAARIAAEDVEAFVALLAEGAEMVPELPEPFPEVGRDRKDDYLFAHALIARADVLVSGDDDLVSFEQIEDVVIVSPARFLAILAERGLLEGG